MDPQEQPMLHSQGKGARRKGRFKGSDGSTSSDTTTNSLVRQEAHISSSLARLRSAQKREAGGDRSLLAGCRLPLQSSPQMRSSPFKSESWQINPISRSRVSVSVFDGNAIACRQERQFEREAVA
ncbi:unnamed protein product [Pleuronectes platessa]|uniref:Uncharacterized protein n=1 Tax=Pleuronectes platessa TaxID=8262 RepID=A0A9N7TTH9_PLEPL|nr:unnamed protein product [Pleuronectes platessa]